MILIRNLPTKVVSCHNIWMNFFTVLHHKNKYGQTLLKILTSQGHTMKAYLDILLKMERSYHQSLNEYTKCLRYYLGSCPGRKGHLQAVRANYGLDLDENTDPVCCPIYCPRVRHCSGCSACCTVLENLPE